jgi:hypothetical protein
MLTVSTHLQWSHDHTWKKRPPNFLSSSFFSVKWKTLVVHYRSCSNDTLFPDEFPDLSPDTFRESRDGASLEKETESQQEPDKGTSYTMVPAPLLTVKLNTPVLHYRSSTHDSILPEISTCPADTPCRYDVMQGTQVTGSTTCTATTSLADKTQNTTCRSEVINQLHPLARPPQLRRPLTEVARLIIPYLGVNVCVLVLVITKYAVCKLIAMHQHYYLQAYIYLKTYQHQRYDINQQAVYMTKHRGQGESNRLHLDSGALHNYVIIFTYCVKSMIESSYSCSPPSETWKTVGGRKKLFHGWTLSAVTPPNPAEVANPPRIRVLDQKSHRIYSDPLFWLTSGCSVARVYTNTRSHYTRLLSGQIARPDVLNHSRCHGNDMLCLVCCHDNELLNAHSYTNIHYACARNVT